MRDGLVSAYRQQARPVERRRRFWEVQLPGGARIQLEGLGCPVLAAPHGLPFCLDSFRRGLGFACPAGETQPCTAATKWILDRAATNME